MRDITILALAGTTQGVFGAGVVTAFEEGDLYPRIRATFGISAGAMNLSYFLARQSKLGSSIYFDDLSTPKFIRPVYVPIGIVGRFIHRHITAIPLKYRVKPVDIDYAFEFVARHKALNVRRLETVLEEVEFKILLGDPMNATASYVDARGETLAKLKAAIALIPYHNQAIEIGGDLRIDGSLIDAMAVREVLSSIPKDDILIVISNFSFERRLRHYIKDVVEAWVASLMFGGSLAYAMRRRIENLKKNLEALNRRKNLLVLQPDPEYAVTPSTISRRKLLRLYTHGIEKGEEILKRL